MITAVLNETCERCKKAALAAFSLADVIDATESGGIGPARIFLNGSYTVNGDDITVKINYTYPRTCGLSDRQYHVVGAGKTFTDVYTFSGGKVALNGGKLFASPTCRHTLEMEEGFFLEFSDVIKECA